MLKFKGKTYKLSKFKKKMCFILGKIQFPDTTSTARNIQNSSRYFVHLNN
jgi:hypothetical protein